MQFHDKAVLITGAARGNGWAIALAFAAERARVAVNDLNPDGAGETVRLVAAACPKSGGTPQSEVNSEFSPPISGAPPGVLLCTMRCS